MKFDLADTRCIPRYWYRFPDDFMMKSKKKSTHGLSDTCIVLVIFVGCFIQPGVTNFPPRLLNFQQSRVIVQSEDTPNGTVIGQLSASDSDGPMEIIFSITDDTTAQLVRLGTASGVSKVRRSVDIILNAQLDRDREPSERKMYFSVADGVQGVEHNTIPVMVSLFITDVNDEVPEFSVLRYKESVYENATVGTTVTKVTAIDPDNGWGGTVTYSMQPVAQAADDDYKQAFRIDPNTGDIIINNTLNFEKHNFYDFVISAQDGYGKPSKHTADFVVTVLDIQDTPPSFHNLPYSYSMSESAAVGSSVLQVTALDGDRGVPNKLIYSFIGGDHENFNLDSSTGWITVKNKLDRDDPQVKQRGGVYAFRVQATEIIKSGATNYGNTTATTLVTVTVKDVNDNPPRFNSETYQATILESMQKGVPVTFKRPTTQMSVSDKDQASNSHFMLTLEKDGKPYYDFAPLPSEVYSESSVLIRVNNSDDLDYEKMKQTSFQIVATEINSPERRTNRANVTVYLEDMNDNEPQFDRKSYAASVSENSPYGRNITQITAHDQDSGSFGMVTYSLRGGNGRFSINNQTGQIFVSGDFDREKIDMFYLTIEAKDGGGFRSIAELEVTVKDENDLSPVFRRSDYYAIVKEGSNTFFRGPLIVVAHDEDEPNTNNSMVRYSITRVPPGLDDNFTVNAETGEVMIKNPLDYERLDPALKGFLTIEIQATDLGSPPNHGTTNVTIEVEDVNDNSPVFERRTYNASVLENATDSTEVIQVKATDGDGTSLNNLVMYRIDSGAKDKFSINYRTGMISVMFGATLDRESVGNYILKISATDRGEIPQLGHSEVTIQIGDVNDELPEFEQKSKTVTVSEALAVNELVTMYTATDTDLNHILQYRIVPDSVTALDEKGNPVNSTSINNYFYVVSDTGEVKVKSAMDRETAEKVTLKMMVTDINAWDPQIQSATAILTVILSDSNDNDPKFSTNIYHVNVSEARDREDVVLTVSATDADKNQIITFSIGTDTTGSFKVSDSTSGMIKLQKKLDRETADTVNFTVVATDNGTPNLRSSTATVIVTVIDINDQAPVFAPSSNHSYDISEDASVGTTVAVITATDADAGDFGRVFYTMVVTDDDGKLVINKSTGVITVREKLDRETRPRGYSIQVQGTDNEKYSNNQKTTIFGPIQINTLDVNDNPPTITSIGPSKVREILVSGNEAFTVTASDPDSGQNGLVKFSLVGPKNTTGTSDWFFVQTIYNNGTKQNEGKIKVKDKLLSKVGVFYITVKAQDRGSPPQSTSKQFVFEVVDVNLHQPKFEVPKAVGDGEIPPVIMKEEQKIGTEVITVRATDEDHGENGNVQYYLSPELDHNKFHLDNITGTLTNTAILDREDPKHKGVYQVKIFAFDQGVISQYKVSVILTIQLLDINDEEPVFKRTLDLQPYYVGHAEEETNSTLVGSVDMATDEDSDYNNTRVCYYLIGGPMKDYFHLTVTGELHLVHAVDRESGPDGTTTDYIDLVVWATSNCYAQLGSNSRTRRSTNNINCVTGTTTPPKEYDCHNETLLWVRVTIDDKNDHRPVFREKDLSIGVTRKTQFGEIIYKLNEVVSDRDAGKNGIHTYRNNSIKFFPYPGTASSISQSAAENSFRLFTNNGTIKSNTYFQSDLSGYYLMNVSVIDKEPPNFSDSAILRITLVNDDQRVKVVFRDTLDNVKKISPKFKDDLERITGYRIVVDKIQTHENSNGKPEVDKTDMYIHAEDKKTNNIIEAAELLGKIDSHASELNDVLNKYNVLQIVPTTQTKEQDDSQRLLLMAIILLAIVLGIPCIVLAIILYMSRKKYQRKLKAATAMAYGSKDSDMHKLEMPGTNLHAYENANPIFMEKVLLEEIGEEEDDDSIDNNAVDPAQEKPYDVQEKSMNFLGESDNGSVYGPKDMNLRAAIKAHEMTKGQLNEEFDHKPMNGHTAGNGTALIDGLPTTEI